MLSEFAGTLLGFDDYVSKYLPRDMLRDMLFLADWRCLDMVLEDVTEL